MMTASGRSQLNLAMQENPSQMLVSNFDSTGSFSGDPPPEVFKNSALLATAIDAAAAGILQGQVNWHCWSSAMPPHIFLSTHFFFWNAVFLPM